MRSHDVAANEVVVEGVGGVHCDDHAHLPLFAVQTRGASSLLLPARIASHATKGLLSPDAIVKNSRLSHRIFEPGPEGPGCVCARDSNQSISTQTHTKQGWDHHAQMGQIRGDLTVKCYSQGKMTSA